MKLVYFGSGIFAVPSLRALAPYVCAVVTQPDRPTGRKMVLTPTPVKIAAEELGLPIHTPLKARDPEFVEWVRSLEADALVVASYGQILSQKLLDSAKRGGINLHGSILPEYRGAAPIQRCLMDGKEETGVTLMQMDKGMDTGDMIAIERIPITLYDTYATLEPKLGDLAAKMAADWMPRIVAGDYPREQQNHELATYAPKISKEDGYLTWGDDAWKIYHRWQGLSPRPGVVLPSPWGPIKLARFTVHPASEDEAPGTVIAVKPNVHVSTAKGVLEIYEIQPEGKPVMSASAWVNGVRLSVGDCLQPS
jgi:methionyl-tRNA formyltransferase